MGSTAPVPTAPPKSPRSPRSGTNTTACCGQRCFGRGGQRVANTGIRGVGVLPLSLSLVQATGAASIVIAAACRLLIPFAFVARRAGSP